MEVGDFVKGLPGSLYSITNEKMTRGIIKSVNGRMITVKVLDHMEGSFGTFEVKPEFFEVIGHVKPFVREEIMEVLKSGCKNALLDYNLIDSDLSGADLRCADLRCADLSDANLRGANLSRANLSGADLRYADLRDSDLSDANLRGANLRGANLDFSCLPLWCGGLRIKCDKRLACQVAYHLCTMQCDDEEYIQMRNSILEFANQFHRVEECGRLEPIFKGGK